MQELKAELVRNNMTQEQAAKVIGVSPATFYRRLKAGTLGLDEANKLIKALGIKNPGYIFFGIE